jgi:hypothetical protein
VMNTLTVEAEPAVALKQCRAVSEVANIMTVLMPLPVADSKIRFNGRLMLVMRCHRH